MRETEGFAAGSRWLSEAIPPVTDPHHPPHPGGVPAQSRPRRWHPCRDAGVHVRTGPRWCRRFAPRPPATRWEASGFMADGRRGHLGCGHPRPCRGRPSATAPCWHAACRNSPAWGSRASLLLTRGFGRVETHAGQHPEGAREERPTNPALDPRRSLRPQFPRAQAGIIRFTTGWVASGCVPTRGRSGWA